MSSIIPQPPAPGFSEDRLLGGSVILRQPIHGFRAALDPVLLAAGVVARAGERVLELGSGTGAASLCLAVRLPEIAVFGVELQTDLVALARDNAALNGLADRVRMVEGDVAKPLGNGSSEALAEGSFDHVMANPPFLSAGRATLPDHPARALAVGEGEADLSIWVRAALAMVRPRGSLSFIHRADRLDALLALLRERAGEIIVFPFWPQQGQPAKRVLVRARRGVATPLKLSAGLVLHQANGAYTDEAEAVLRHGQALPLS